MPKTTKRAETRRATRVARAHATELPKLEVKDSSKDRRRSPGYKPPARGVARYPWASVILFGLIAVGIVVLAINHLGPFAPPAPQAKVKPVATVAPIATQADPAASPCNSSAILTKITNTSAVQSAADIAKIQHTYSSAPKSTIDTHKLYCAGINTSKGLIVLELNPSLAPNTVNNFVYLAQNHFYDGQVFHRVLPNTAATKGQLQIAQTGSPTGKGDGGPGYKFNDEPVKGKYTAGTVAMANSGANTNGSQFFICTGDDSTLLQAQYNLFGRVTKGLDVAQKLQGPSDTDTTIKSDVMNYVLVVPAS